MAAPEAVQQANELLIGALGTAVTAVLFLARALAKERKRPSAGVVVDYSKMAEMSRAQQDLSAQQTTILSRQAEMEIQQRGLKTDFVALRQDFERAQETFERRMDRNEKMFRVHLEESRQDSERLEEALRTVREIERRLPQT